MRKLDISLPTPSQPSTHSPQQYNSSSSNTSNTSNILNNHHPSFIPPPHTSSFNNSPNNNSNSSSHNNSTSSINYPHNLTVHNSHHSTHQPHQPQQQQQVYPPSTASSINVLGGSGGYSGMPPYSPILNQHHLKPKRIKSSIERKSQKIPWELPTIKRVIRIQSAPRKYSPPSSSSNNNTNNTSSVMQKQSRINQSTCSDGKLIQKQPSHHHHYSYARHDSDETQSCNDGEFDEDDIVNRNDDIAEHNDDAYMEEDEEEEYDDDDENEPIDHDEQQEYEDDEEEEEEPLEREDDEYNQQDDDDEMPKYTNKVTGQVHRQSRPPPQPPTSPIVSNMNQPLKPNRSKPFALRKPPPMDSEEEEEEEPIIDSSHNSNDEHISGAEEEEEEIREPPKPKKPFLKKKKPMSVIPKPGAPTIPMKKSISNNQFNEDEINQSLNITNNNNNNNNNLTFNNIEVNEEFYYEGEGGGSGDEYAPSSLNSSFKSTHSSGRSLLKSSRRRVLNRYNDTSINSNINVNQSNSNSIPTINSNSKLNKKYILKEGEDSMVVSLGSNNRNKNQLIPQKNVITIGKRSTVATPNIPNQYTNNTNANTNSNLNSSNGGVFTPLTPTTPNSSSNSSNGIGGGEDEILDKALSDPEQEVFNCIDLIQSEGWEDQLSGIMLVIRLTKFHSDIMDSKIHDMIPTIIKLATNLRSSISKTALKSLEELYIHNSKMMDVENESIVPILLRKTTDTNKFINTNSLQALLKMIYHTSNSEKTIGIVMNQIPGMKHGSIRTIIARLMFECLTRRLNSNIFRMQKLIPKFYQSLAELSKEGNMDCRGWVKQSILSLCGYYNGSKEDFKKFTQKHVSDKIFMDFVKIIDKN